MRLVSARRVPQDFAVAHLHWGSLFVKTVQRSALFFSAVVLFQLLAVLQVHETVDARRLVGEAVGFHQQNRNLLVVPGEPTGPRAALAGLAPSSALETPARADASLA